MSSSAGQRAAAARAALLANLPNVDELTSELAGAEPSLGLARGEIDIDSVAALLSTEFGAKGTTNVARRAPSSATEAANRVAAARLALAEAEKYQDDLDASTMYVVLKCPIPRAVDDGLLPSAYAQLSVPTGVRCVFPVVPDSMEEPLDFSCLYPFQVVDSHSGDLKYHFMAYGACQYHLARISPALELLSAQDTASPAARATAHLCRQVVSNVCEILSQRMDLALLTAKGDAAMIRYVTQCMTADLDGLQLQSPHMRKHLVDFRKKKNVEALKKATKGPP